MTLRNKAAGADTLGADGDKGDVTVGGTGTTLTIDANAVTYAKMQDVSAGDKVLGRITGSGDPEEIACTAAGRALLDDANAAAQRTTLGLGTAAVAATGDFEAAGVVATHAAGVGHPAFTGDSGAGGVKGMVPAPAAGDAAAGKYMKADGTWATPPGSLDITGLTAETAPADADTMPIYDASATANRKVTLAEMRAYMAEHIAQVRFLYSSTAQVALYPFGGSLVEVNGEIVDVGSGLTRLSSANLINSTGADAGAACGASTIYYAYVSNSLASFSPSTLRLSTTSPTGIHVGAALSAGYDDFYLGTSGNARHWRFVGMCRTDGSTLFQDTATQRFVASYYNRLNRHLISCPAYASGNTQTSWTTTSTTWARANAGTGSRIEWLSFGDESVSLMGQGLSTSSGSYWNSLGVGLDSTTDAVVESTTYVTSATNATMMVQYATTPAVGYHYAELMVKVGGGTGTYVADNARSGAVADPYITYISGMIRC